MKHDTGVPAAATITELGTKVAQLRYDAIIVFLRAFADEIFRQQQVDAQKKRAKIALVGALLVRELRHTSTLLQIMLDISIPFMRKDIKKTPLIRK